MEDIQNVVHRIVDACALDKIRCTPTLAAFVARVVILERPKDFQLNKSLNDKDVQALVDLCLEKLRLEDSAHMETLRMQVEFDTLFMETEEALKSNEQAKRSRRNVFRSSIVNMDHSAGSEYEMINNMYRQVFNYLISCAGADVAKDLAVEREIAAALESVFPKIGLKAFMLLDLEDQKIQLSELASIVMGIRLFNRHIGKGGAGMKDLPGLARKSAQALLQDLRDEKDAIQATCEEYSSTLVFAHRCKPGQGPEKQKVDKWQDELNNRRQLLAFISSLEDDAIHALQTLQKLADQFEQVMVALQELVGQNSSVSKDQVYPKFDVAAEIWDNLRQEFELIESRHTVWRTLQGFRDSCSFTLDAHWLESALQDERWGEDKSSKRSILDSAPPLDTTPSPSGSSAAGEEKSAESSVQEQKSSDGSGARHAGDGPELLTPESTPEFMNLTLDYQGFCPVTAARRGGLLLPGDPSLGVVRYRNTHQVFYSDECLQQFMQDPDAVIAGLINTARSFPELINLLELQRHFPETALMNFLRVARASGGKSLGQAQDHGKPIMVDAATETPTHFVESHIDPSYEWNEWALRRRALQLVNLRKAKTSSTQTIKSHFRRESEAQVYLPKDAGSQTGISRGTNAPRKVQYITGLRGLSKTRFAKDAGESKTRDEEEGKASSPNVVRMTFEL